MAKHLGNNSACSNFATLFVACICSKPAIFIFAALLTGVLLYADLAVKPSLFGTAKPPADEATSTDQTPAKSLPSAAVKTPEKDKWAQYIDMSTMPVKAMPKGDPDVCKADKKCTDFQIYSDVFELLMAPATYRCDYVRLFGNGDGGGGQGPYRVCFDKPFRPVPGHCLVYSFGISNDWTFDDIMAAHGCAVFSFDPSIGLQHHKRKEGPEFYPWGIWGNDEKNAKGWEMKTLVSIQKALGHENKTIDIFKIDTEGAEVPTFAKMIDNGYLQKYVKQILVEWHPGNEGNIPEYVLASYHRLHNEAGFKTFYSEPRWQFERIFLVESLINTAFDWK